MGIPNGFNQLLLNDLLVFGKVMILEGEADGLGDMWYFLYQGLIYLALSVPAIAVKVREGPFYGNRPPTRRKAYAEWAGFFRQRAIHQR